MTNESQSTSNDPRAGWFEKHGITNPQPSLRTRLEAAMKDGKMTSEELRNIAEELDKIRDKTSMELTNLKEVVGGFGRRILQEYTVASSADIPKLESLLKALSQTGAIKSGTTIDPLPANATNVKLCYDEKTNKMRAMGLFEGLWQTADETKVAAADLLRLQYANTILKDPATREQVGTLIEALKEVLQPQYEYNKVVSVNELLAKAFPNSPLPNNIRVSRDKEISWVIEFFSGLLKRREEDKSQAQAQPPAANWVTQTQTTPAAPSASTATPDPAPATVAQPPHASEAQQPKLEEKEKAQNINQFVTALSNDNPDQRRITQQVSKLAQTEIQKALSDASLNKDALNLLALPLGDRQKNTAFQQAIGMKLPHDGYIGRETINALMEKIGSSYRVPPNPYSPSKK